MGYIAKNVNLDRSTDREITVCFIHINNGTIYLYNFR